jgi:hypothetical protein
MTKTLLFAFCLLANLSSQSPSTHLVPGTIEMKQVPILKDGHRARAVVRKMEISVVSSDGKTMRADVIMVYEPISRLFWWQYQALESEEPRTDIAKSLSDYVVYIAKDKIYGFSFSRPFLWVRESEKQVSNLDQGQEEVLADVKKNADKIAAQTATWAHPVNVGAAMGPGFLSLDHSASLFPQPRLRTVSRVKDQWHLIFDGPNKDSAEIVLSDDYKVVSTTHFPAKNENGDGKK